ncbi:sucrase ferredoxin [Rhodococcus sp. ABRD24]|uniref:sucrase ferredoxin n=1 Tax=Rhodococcus sp. ABRD24 TaxID=2507582 RepID=UPI00103D5927|nr:sucrase ferredoxin [Rhodococcus sp. ABRD24]QBJ98564.1 sucrase ferredoxin [Rhodococcus sp. ABRD24]
MTCSALSAADEPLPGTAAQVGGWVCIEYPGAWGRDVLDGTALGAELARELTLRADAAGVRIMFIRRPGRSETAHGSRTVLLANSRPEHSWCERLAIGDVSDLLSLDLARVSGPAPGLGERVTDPVVLVCAHGKRDQCCAVLGRPVAAVLAAEFGDAVWECSHTGGHRFAPSMILLPSGNTYGRLGSDGSLLAVHAAADGRVYLPGLRGRSSWSPRGQVAEVAVRQQVLAGVDELAVDERAGDDPVVVHRDGRRWQVTLEQRELAPRPASCGAEAKPVRPVVAVRVQELPDREGQPDSSEDVATGRV